MKWARVLKDTAVEVIEFDPSGRFHPAVEALFIPVPDHVQVNARLIGGEWVNPPEPPQPTPEMIAEQQAQAEAAARDARAASVRAERNNKLAASDWTQLADAPVDQVAWAAYRQALRDIPEQAGFPDDVIWPTEPQ
jgi:hypothetical protein